MWIVLIIGLVMLMIFPPVGIFLLIIGAIMACFRGMRKDKDSKRSGFTPPDY